jgi:D-glycero-D-manno-heptose 1,7-bisphosphate phosphatase
MIGNRRKAAYLDRDGTINEEVDYLREANQLRLIPGAAEAIRRLRQQGWLAIVVTNQSGIARGYLSESQLSEIHDQLRHLLAQDGAELDAIYYCPHHPTFGDAPYRRDCGCRKPKTGMIEQAARDFSVETMHSVVIGDRLQDIEMAHAAGSRGILVKTGYGEQELTRAGMAAESSPDYTASDLLDAVNWVLAQDEPS